MEVELIKAHDSFDGSARRKIERLRVAAYCRVSTDDEDQIKSYNSMVTHYTELIKNNKEWIFSGIYADKAITGTKVDKREEFQRLIQDCMDGKIDMIIAKSLPRFARNTLDTLKYVRMLKERSLISSGSFSPKPDKSGSNLQTCSCPSKNSGKYFNSTSI